MKPAELHVEQLVPFDGSITQAETVIVLLVSPGAKVRIPEAAS